MKRSVLIANVAVAVLALAVIVGYQFTTSEAGSGCEGDQKIEGSGGTYVAPAGTSISGVCIKAGREVFNFSCGDAGDGCYTLDWTESSPGCCTAVTVGGGGTSRECKAISHSAATFGGPDCEPPPSPTPEPSPTPYPG